MDTALSLNNHRLLACIKKTGARVFIRAASCGHHLCKGDTVILQLYGIGNDLVLLDLTSKGSDLGNSRNSQQSWPDSPIRQRTQIGQRGLAGGETDFQQNACWRTDGHHLRLARCRRQMCGCNLEFLGNELPRAKNVGIGLKDACDDRKSDNRGRANRIQFRRTIQLRL